MYSSCLFCNGGLGANEVIEHFPVGRRLAFDAAKGRLWVVCVKCHRWNLTPIEERFEAIEQCERRYRATSIRVSTDQIGLARLSEGLELIRIGSPLRPEFAAWRYARQFRRRRNRASVMGGATVAGAGLASAAIGATVGPTVLNSTFAVVAAPGVTTMLALIPIFAAVVVKDYLTYDRVVARFMQGKRAVQVRAHHLGDIEMQLGGGTAALRVPHDTGWAQFSGTEAIHATSVIMANTNRAGADQRGVQSAVDQIERAGDAEGYLDAASRRNSWRGLRPVSVLAQYRGLGAMNLSGTERLALEMAVHEESERRAMSGELDELRAAWRKAEEIAAICDGLLTPV